MLSSSHLHIKTTQDLKTCTVSRMNDILKVLQISSSTAIMSDVNHLMIIDLFNVSKLHITLTKIKISFMRTMSMSIRQMKQNWLTHLIRILHLIITDIIIRKHKHTVSKKKWNKSMIVTMKTTSCLLIYISSW